MASREGACGPFLDKQLDLTAAAPCSSWRASYQLSVRLSVSFLIVLAPRSIKHIGPPARSQLAILSCRRDSKGHPSAPVTRAATPHALCATKMYQNTLLLSLFTSSVVLGAASSLSQAPSLPVSSEINILYGCDAIAMGHANTYDI